MTTYITSIRNLPATLLPLSDYARLLGINPAHFFGGAGGTIFPTYGSCNDVWPRHTWQSTEELMSREEIAISIREAEHDIKEILGFSPAPDWEVEEVQPYPTHYNVLGRHGTVLGADRRYKNIQTFHGRVISAGRRATTIVEAASTVVYSDEDGDGFDETATITAATALTDVSQLKLYHTGTLAVPEWEIRPVRSKAIAGGVATFVLDSWLCVDPGVEGAFPTGDGTYTAIDLDAAASYVTTVDVYREYNNPLESSVTFFWNPPVTNNIFCTACGGVGCNNCQLSTQDGCMTVRDAPMGLVTPFPATLTDEVWSSSTWAVCRAPDMVKLWYYAGDIGTNYLAGYANETMDHYIAMAIVWLATSRTEGAFCSCSNVQNTVNELRRDISVSPRDKFIRSFSKQDIYDNPWGSRVGAVQAWRRIDYMMGNKAVVQGGGF